MKVKKSVLLEKLNYLTDRYDSLVNRPVYKTDSKSEIIAMKEMIADTENQLKRLKVIISRLKKNKFDN